MQNYISYSSVSFHKQLYSIIHLHSNATKPDTSKSATRKSDRTSKKIAKVAENEKISEENEQSDRLDTESDTDSVSGDAQLVVNQTLTISAMKNMLDEALERLEKSLKLSITEAVASAIAPISK